MSSISSNLYEGNKPITFQVSQCWIILKKNLVLWNELKSGENKFLWKVKKSENWLEKKEKTKAQKEVNAELFVAE